MRRLTSSSLFVLGLCVVQTLPVSAQLDMEDNPLFPTSPVTRGAETLGGGLPSVPELAQAHGLDRGDLLELETWRESWDLMGDEGVRVRVSQVYPGVAARLYPLLSRPGMEALLEGNEESLQSALRLVVLLADVNVEQALEDAYSFHQKAVSALEAEDGETALRFALQSADALRDVSPERVASELLQKAQGKMRRNPGLDAYPEEKLIRIRRLTYGAAEALADGDYPRAIRRAYYACQLLGVEPG